MNQSPEMKLVKKERSIKEVNFMTTKHSFGKRITSVFLALTILFTMIPLTAMTAAAASVDGNRVADPSTMDAWSNFFPITGDISTENAGGVWTDKSVFTDASAFAGTGITQDDPNSFLVALSAMAANMTITGTSSVPTDSILILDVSGSMNDNQGNNDVAEALVDAANDSIAALLATNKYSRVGVVLYSGPTTQGGATSANDAVVVLPLGRYTTGTDGEYLNYNVTGGRDTTESVSIDTDVVYEGTTDKPSAVSKTVVGGTYIQKGVAAAMNQFIAESNETTVNDSAMGVLNRKPVIVLMSDGAPTVGTTSFTAPGTINLGDGTSTSAALGFVNQLTASYAKSQIEAKYGCDALFYTLGLGLGTDGIAIGVLDPDNANASTALSDFWTQYNAAAVGGSVTVQSGRNSRTVQKIATALEQNYVDQYFEASGSDLSAALVQAFQDIVGAIQLQSGYYPTLISGDEDLSGYISFVDKIGQYMDVTDVKGILIGDHLFSGADLASNFVPGGGALGSYDSPTELGLEMVAAVRARLGLDSDETARTLIFLAYENGQLSYTDANNFSNYIGWYANAAGEILGFYNEGTTVLPEATGNVATDPAFTVKSYGYLGAVDESHGVKESDMMYATVQVRKSIATGEELVTFAVPAALIPTVTYEVTLNEEGKLDALKATGATAPIRLVYEVTLDAEINSFNVKEIVSAEYLAENTNSDGSINFYTNQWDHENKTDYGTVNTYSYFNPSRQNDKFYFVEDTAIYSDTNGALYKGTSAPDANGEFYHSYVIYKRNGALESETVYRKLSAASLATAKANGDGTWYIPKGDVRTNWTDYTDSKDPNATATLSYAHLPFVDTTNHSVDEEGYEFYAGAVLGNNGKYTVVPQTGIKLSKDMADGVSDPGKAFSFTLTNTTSADDNSTYSAWLVKADGTEVTGSVTFADGVATVELNAGDTLYIGGMTAGHTFKIVEVESVEYVASASGLSDTDTVTVVSSEIKSVTFVNDLRGTGNLTVAKEVEHDFGQDYQIPADKVFTMQVTLSGIGTANATFAAAHTDGTYSRITTDANGQFAVELKHEEQFEIFGLPAGTTATVVEQTPAKGFTPAYWDNGVLGDGVVTVVKNSTVSVIVVNDYTATEVYPVNINLGGSKVVKDANGDTVTTWLDSYSFEIVLERYDTTSGWTEIGRKTVNKNNQTFSFNGEMAREEYTAPGVYSYQMYEVEPAVGATGRVDGMIYDLTWHTFSVHVSDADMDGQLEIVRVHSEHANKDFELVNGVYTINAGFENTQTVTVPALATVEIQKLLNNPSGSTAVSLAGYTFGLYSDPECSTAAVTGKGVKTINLVATDAVGEGWIDIQFDKEGEYTFYIKEIAGTQSGMTYSQQIIKIVVNVTSSGSNAGVLVAKTSYIAEDGSAYTLTTDGFVEFTNSYDPKDAELPIDFVSKQLNGRDMTSSDSFTFEVQTQDGSTVLKGSNNGTDKVTFNGTLKFDEVGTYFYNIVETSANGNGVTVDKTTYRMTVTVVDDNGTLKATYAIVNATGNTVTFVNDYTAASVDHSIDGTKTLRGRTLINDEFTFVLTETNVQNPKTWTSKNFADGSFAFPTITYSEAGTYTYQVEEKLPEGGKTYGITYDAAKYVVTVIIKDDGAGKLYVASETYAMLNGTSANALSFLNEYEADPTSAQFTGDKTLTGKVNNALAGGEFEFELYNSDASWTQGSLREKVSNGEGGKITFTKIDFATDEDQYFLVKEVNGGQTIKGITYDDTVFRVYVEVTDDLKGKLHATVHIYDGEGVPQDTISFVNIYEVTGDANVTLSGEKIISGRSWKDGDSFTFELYAADENYIASGSPVETAVANSNKHTYSINLTYGADDIGKTFYYVLKENSANPISGLTYSTTQYKIKVVVEDDDEGGVKTTVTVENATTYTLNFVNEYGLTSGESVKFEATKTLQNKDLGNIKFSFDLIESNANWESVKVLQTKENNGGAIVFDKINYTAAGDWYYIIAEQKAGQTVAGITYDTTTYRIHVKVTDNLDGTLSKTVTITKVAGDTSATVDAIAFVNSYAVTGTDSIELSGTKTFEGRDWTENDAFVIELYGADANFEILSSDPVATVTVDRTTGKFTITRTYGVSDLGETFYYVAKEKNAGQKIDGITYSGVEYKITVTVKDNGDGTVKAEASIDGAALNALNFTNSYSADKAVVGFDGSKTLDTLSGARELKENDFTFDLYKANDSFELDGAAIQSKKNDANGDFSFDDVEFTEAGTYYFVVKENSQNPIGGVVYDNTQYHITVVVTDNGEGELIAQTTMLKVNGDTTAQTDAIEFVNKYNASVANVTISGEKNLTGRDPVDGEFKFLMVEADEAFNPVEGEAAMIALNANGSFTFDALSFTEVGTYYFVVTEDGTVQAERVTFDATVYYVTIEVTDDDNGSLVASTPVIVKKGSTDAVETISFTNVFTPKPAEVTVNIDILKTVVIKGADVIGPEGFEFLLKSLADGVDGITVKSDKDGKAQFTLTFTEDDIGKSFSYKLTEVNSGQYGVTYSTAEYLITIEVTLNSETNELVATMSVNEAAVAEFVAQFENTYDADIPDNPKTGDNTNLALWVALMFVSGGAAITLGVYDKKKRRLEEN